MRSIAFQTFEHGGRRDSFAARHQCLVNNATCAVCSFARRRHVHVHIGIELDDEGRRSVLVEIAARRCRRAQCRRAHCQSRPLHCQTQTASGLETCSRLRLE
jgi:hypothetical protein